jgi:lysophospholipase L1-like esterase/pimeloyl-ACP methyl ester carboxylesterase
MRYLLFIFIVFSSLVSKAQTDPKIKVACIGASITYGARIENREQNSYPAQLQKMLGSNYEVNNYGVSGCTLLKKGDKPYWKTKEYQSALASQPNVVIIDLGGNDSKLINRIYLNEYENDYQDFIRSFTQLPSHPRIVLLLAMPSFVKDTAGIWDPVIIKKINPLIQQVAYTEHVEVIDMHSPFINKEAIMPDKIHPDKEGAGIMAKNVYDNLVQSRDKEFNLFNNLKIPVKQSSFYGYDCADFTFNGRACKIAKPKFAAKGHPWVWRARFWGHEPQTDIVLLQQGFHIVYCDVAELLGNAEAITVWNKYYQLLQNAGLAKKAVMEGMSRGGVYVFNWAAVNTDKVAAVYVDNPLLNIPSWSEKVMATPDVKSAMFEAFKQDYNLVTNQDVRNFKGSPVDKVKQIVKGKYPILILCADADEEVSPQDNTLLFEQKVKDLNGNITVVHKPGFKHHPHSLPNPEPIVDFILKATSYYLPVPQNG